MPITSPSVGDPTKQSLIQAIIDALAAAEVDIAAILGERMITNGSFEVDTDSDGFPDQWTRTLYTGGAFALVDDDGTGAFSAHGLKSIKFTHPGGGGNGGGEIVTHADTFIEVTPKRGYWLTWNNKNSVAGVTNSVDILEYDATQTQIATTTVFSQTTNPTSWTLFKVQFKTADPLTRYIKIKFKCGETSASTAGDIYIDDVQLRFATYENKYVVTGVGSGTWTAPDGIKCVEIELIGGGGGGGGNNGGGSNGGGGGGGGYTRFLATVTSGTAYSFAVGAGGSAGAIGGGGAGGQSSMTIGSTSLVANGGSGGAGDGGSGAGGAGGTASGGDINSTGGTGGAAGGSIGGIGGIVTPIGISGAGAATSANGVTGQHFGAGGSGAVGSTGSANGGAGASGALIIRW